jgi:hypothetical protein
LAAALSFGSALCAPARADLTIAIDKSSQRMTVAVDGVRRHVWPVSTGRIGHETPDGTFTPFRLEEDHYSKEWDDAPMPHSVFFTKQGHAIHGSDVVSKLGAPASAGCVRLSRANAAALFALVKEQGLAKTRVSIQGVEPAPAPAVARRGNARITAAPLDPPQQIVPGRRPQYQDDEREPLEAYSARMRQRYLRERAQWPREEEEFRTYERRPAARTGGRVYYGYDGRVYAPRRDYPSYRE